jgi:hypothetical protein
MTSPTPPSFRSARAALGAAIFGVAAAIFAPSLAAQISPGLLGTRHFEASLFTEDIREQGIDSGTGLTLRVNLPLRESIDLNIGGILETIDTYDFEEKQAMATLVVHGEASGFRPFADVSLGGVWQSSTVDGVNYKDDQAFGGLGVGVEAPVADATALVGRIAYNKFFSSEAGDFWLYSVGVNHWVSRKFVILGAATFREQDSIYYSVGIGLKF